jgi:recombinational DNA repair protein RecT
LTKPQNNGRSGNGSQQQHQQIQPNAALSHLETVKSVLRELNARGKELRPILPVDIPFDAFLANVNTALRNNPSLLECTFDSIVAACVKGAYDGLRLDGREAAIVVADESYKDQRNQWQKRKVARYMPMVFGLIKQILDCGAALTVKAIIVYSEEAKTGRFRMLEGTVQGIHHEPILEGDKGHMIGAYAIAMVKPNVFKFEWMDRIAIEDVQKEAKTDKVWLRWPTEMWKKTAIRRLRKSLAGTSRIIDMEATEMFPQFDKSLPHPQLAEMGHNQQSSMPARPTRENYGALEHDNSQPFSNFGNATDERELVDRDQQRGDDRQQQQSQQQDPARSDPARQDAQIPADDAEWGVWEIEMTSLIEKVTDLEALGALHATNEDALNAAPDRFLDPVQQAFTDRAADLAADTNDGAAAGDGQNDTAAGDD